jgi:hypothetical protein
MVFVDHEDLNRSVIPPPGLDPGESGAQSCVHLGALSRKVVTAVMRPPGGTRQPSSALLIALAGQHTEPCGSARCRQQAHVDEYGYEPGWRRIYELLGYLEQRHGTESLC